jgi:hypothetical protein
MLINGEEHGDIKRGIRLLRRWMEKSFSHDAQDHEYELEKGSFDGV